jgi:hypothetical protein
LTGEPSLGLHGFGTDAEEAQILVNIGTELVNET